jgi:hypothetical protein
MTLPFLALVEAFRAQHDVERLVPGHVLQAQRDVARHRVADHDVLAAGFSQQLQHRARFDVLEIERQALALVFTLRRVDDGRLDLRTHLEHVVAIALVGELLEIAGAATTRRAPLAPLARSNELTGVAKSTTS